MDSDSVGYQINFNNIYYVLKIRKNKWEALIDPYPWQGKEEEERKPYLWSAQKFLISSSAPTRTIPLASASA